MQEPKKYNHYFVDEAGDMIFFGKGHVSLIETTGAGSINLLNLK
jgi:hypothetical protein